MAFQTFNARMLAAGAHAGQIRRGGQAYIEHPRRVAHRVKVGRHPGMEPDGQLSAYAQPLELMTIVDRTYAVAWLHDVLEDTSVKVSDLKAAGIDDKVIASVVLLTKTDTDRYEDYIARVARDPIAREVKIADILDNLSDDPTPNQIIKYSKALLYLHGQPWPASK